MEGVHRDLVRPSQPVQPAAGCDPDRMRLALAHLGRGLHRRRMVEPVRQVLQPLMQRSAQRHVQFLKSPANRQHRHAPGDGGADQRQGDSIPGGVFRGALGVRWTVIQRGLDIRPAAGQDDPVQAIQQGFDIRGRPVGGQQHRDGADHLIGGADIRIGCRMVRHSEDAELLGAATDADQRLDDAGGPHVGKDHSLLSRQKEDIFRPV